MNATQELPATTTIQRAPLPLIPEEEEEEQQTRLSEHQHTKETERQEQQQSQQKKQRRPGKSFYFTTKEQRERWRKLRHQLEDMYGQDIKDQDMFRYMVEQVDLRFFSNFGTYLEQIQQEG
jgi:hypothetical protein